ncbi:hypothetical protein M3913_002953 [Vibrio metschnikovii]|nr:hypothetical protein [Vibrio metschnikovii]EKO3625591.1 hypothetical protein [Vibrio metschnikovii]
MNVRKVAVIGHSQTIALERFYKQHSSEIKEEFVFLNLFDERYKPNYSRGRVNKKIIEDIINLTKLGYCLVFSIGGGRHNVFGLVKHPISFQVISDKHKNHQIIANDIITRFHIKNILNEELFVNLEITKQIAEIIKIKCYFLESPAPVPCDKFLSSVNSRFREHIEINGSIEKYTRYAIWDIQSTIIKSVVNDIGWEYINIPDETKDSEGFLSKEYWKDPTHGNDIFGGKFINKIVGIIE